MELLLFELKNVFLPELSLLIAIAVIFIMELFFSKPLYKLSSRTALIATILPMLAISTGIAHTGHTIFSEMYVQSNFSIVLKLLILIGTFLTILLSQNIIKKIRYRAFEYYLIMLIGTFSAMCLVSANNFVSMFVAMETLFVACCMLIGFWDKYRPKEAAIKYLINSAVATAIFLFGVSILYGISGELSFTMLNLHYYGQDTSVLFMLASVFIIIGLMFKTGCVPFQRWVPDVYQGSPYPVAAYLSVVPKLAAFGILARIIGNFMTEMPMLQIVISFIALLTVAFGLLGAIKQNDIKRFLGYSSIAHCGFMLLALSIFSVFGVAAFIYYAVVYLFMNFGAWAAGITFVACVGSDNIKDYQGIFYVRPYYTTAFVICLIALAGLPPTAGFLAKIFLFSSLTRMDLTGLPVVIIAIILTIYGVFAYMNLIRTLFEKTRVPSILTSPQMNTKVVLYFCTIMTIVTCFFANQVVWCSMFAALGI